MNEVKAIKSKSTFRMECGVGININAPAEKIWQIITNAGSYKAWNSTVISLDGKVAKGEKIQLKVKIAPQRVFKLKVSEFIPASTMVWEDGMAPMFKGVRTFNLTPGANGTTEFLMVEVFSGIMLPLIAGSLPDFGPEFEKFATDLKKEAEKTI